MEITEKEQKTSAITSLFSLTLLAFCGRAEKLLK
jgi:hypothetical protein